MTSVATYTTRRPSSEIEKGGEPQEFVEDQSGAVVTLPALHGRQFHKHSSLPLYILHAWIWEENPEGMFADFNTAVGPCPANLASLTIH